MMVSRSCIVAAMAEAFSSVGLVLSKGNPEHFFNGHHAVEHFLQRVLPERLHALGLSRLADLDRRRVPDDQVANLLRCRHDLVYGHASPHAGGVASRAPLSLVEAYFA